jgi:tetratricopeptide (TPR) repeat protein
VVFCSSSGVESWLAASKMLWSDMLACKVALSIAVALGVSFPNGASAEAARDAAPSPDAGASAAQALFDRGRALVKQGRTREACPLFEKSQELDPGLGTEFNLADCYERLGKLASAHALFARVAESARATAQEKRARVAGERAAAVAPRVSKLVITVPGDQAAGLRIERDGVEIAVAEWNVPVAVDPGVHRVRAWGPELGQWATEVSVTAEGTIYKVAVPESDEPDFFSPLHRKLGLAAAGVGVVGVSAGTIFGVRAIIKKNEAIQAGCDGARCTSEGGELRDQARRAGNAATLTMSIGVAGLATAAVLIWVVSDSESESPESNRSAKLELHPRIATDSAGLWLRGEF